MGASASGGAILMVTTKRSTDLNLLVGITTAMGSVLAIIAIIVIHTAPSGSPSVWYVRLVTPAGRRPSDAVMQ